MSVPEFAFRKQTYPLVTNRQVFSELFLRRDGSTPGIVTVLLESTLRVVFLPHASEVHHRTPCGSQPLPRRTSGAGAFHCRSRGWWVGSWVNGPLTISRTQSSEQVRGLSRCGYAGEWPQISQRRTRAIKSNRRSWAASIRFLCRAEIRLMEIPRIAKVGSGNRYKNRAPGVRLVGGLVSQYIFAVMRNRGFGVTLCGVSVCWKNRDSRHFAIVFRFDLSAISGLLPVASLITLKDATSPL